MSKAVFVGNIPFEMTEEQIIDIFKEVGPVVNFRLMFDRETGKPRGFGFCEFMDAETARSAIRNLNGYDVGGRQLKVSTADNEMPSTYSSAPMASPPFSGTQMPSAMAPPPLLPPHIMVPPPTMPASFGVEAINATLSSLTNQQLSEIIIQMKNLANTSPAQAAQIFQANPALAYAIFQSLVSMRLVDPNAIQELLNQQQFGVGHTMSSQQLMQSSGQPAITTTPQQPMYNVDDQQKALLAQILSLTEEQVNALPEGQRQQVRQLRMQYGKK